MLQCVLRGYMCVRPGITPEIHSAVCFFVRLINNHKQARKFIRLTLAGYTTGDRNGSAGLDVGVNNEDDDGNDAIMWPPDM